MAGFEVRSVNISKEKGTIKTQVDHIQLDGLGVVNDAHAGNWNRQVSLLAKESIDKFEHQNKRAVKPGEFAENITTEGLALYHCRPLDVFKNDAVLLEVTQIGKKCHGSNCSIFQEVGNCVMPAEGIFCRVKRGGTIKPGDAFIYEPKQFKTAVITLSDRASAGIYPDKSGEIVHKRLSAFFNEKSQLFSIHKHLIPDDAELLEKTLNEAIANEVDVIITTGGTGIGPRDITPDVVAGVIDREIPGIMDLIRLKYGAEKPQALLSRSIAGVKGKTLIYSIPGSTRGVEEYLKEILPTLLHSLYMIHGLDIHG